MRDDTEGPSPGPSPLGPNSAQPSWRARVFALVRGRALYALVSLLLLAPVFWQPRVQAGDLSSHIYNAWLAQLIETGKAQGLVLVSQTTNILFDLILSALFQVGGAEFAQRISVSLAVLTFVWGAFAFIWVVSGRKPWHLMPSIAMLAYGWVFHMGFFNFYLSLGLCFWALALAWELKPRRMAVAAPLLVLAYAGHALPVAWTTGLLLYLWLASRISPRRRVFATVAWLTAMVGLNAVVGRTVFSRWSLQQIKMTTGADQVWVFDEKYYLVLVGLLLVWGLMFIRLLRKSGLDCVVSSIAFQFCVISAAAVFILPTTILIPGFNHNLVYIAERMSLGVGVCVCALLGASAPRNFERYALLVVAIVFFGFLYRDERVLNSFEDQMSDTVAQLTPGQRIVSGVDDPDLHVNALTHMIDRVCLGRCFSFANYEPSTAQFRIRAMHGNPYVAATYADSWRMQMGTYVVKPLDLPLYQVNLDKNGNLAIRSLEAGKACGSTPRRALPSLSPWSAL